MKSEKSGYWVTGDIIAISVKCNVCDKRRVAYLPASLMLGDGLDLGDIVSDYAFENYGKCSCD